MGGYVKDGYTQVGVASWYGIDEHNNHAANGERFSKYAYTAAHRSLPMGTVVRVTNLENGRDVIVKINDRGPFVGGRVIDLSYTAAKSIGMVEKGTVEVKVEVISTPSTRDGSYFQPLYTVQVASFSDKGNALILKRELDGDYDDVRIESVDVSGDSYWRVRVGRFEDKQDADNTASRLRTDGHYGRVIME
ncbi:MAG TPA: septal ring lytic transglycosylase RlpA family protein [Thermodesulfobacteriota bacterium]|jgi:rare lipoprotein A|nr:septal ring lytic transglycosylase RlpA family protein [Thermodesulfobacteriota bacterium]